MSDAVLIALLSGPAVVTLDRLITWWRNRRKEDAAADLTTGEAWRAIVSELRGDIADLRDRVKALEDEREQLLDRVKGLIAEVDHYRRIARSMARHVLRLRDALAATGADVPVLPTDVEDALTIIDMPGGAAS